MTKTMVLLIGVLPNPINYKRIDAEKELGELHLICWDRGANMLGYPKEDGYSAHVIKVSASSNPLKRVIPYCKFFSEAYRLLKNIKPSVIHVQAVDMLKIACRYKQCVDRNVRIIYEVPDLHRLLVDEQKTLFRKMVQKYLLHEDKRCCKLIDLLIVTSEKYIDQYFKHIVPAEKIMYFPNVPNLNAFKAYKKKELGDSLVVGYIGGIRYKRQMWNLITAAQHCGMKLMIAGFENEPLEIEPACKDNPNIEWFGRFDFDTQIAELYGKCDIMYSVYDADMENVRVALPNKLYEAVYCEQPLIVAKNTYLSDVVNEWGVGIAVDHKAPDELIATLTMLQNNRQMYEMFSSNCRKHKAEIDLTMYNDKLTGNIERFFEKMP